MQEQKLAGATERSPQRGEKTQEGEGLGNGGRKVLRRTPSRFFRDCKLSTKKNYLDVTTKNLFGNLSQGNFCEGLGRS